MIFMNIITHLVFIYTESMLCISLLYNKKNNDAMAVHQQLGETKCKEPVDGECDALTNKVLGI